MKSAGTVEIRVNGRYIRVSNGSSLIEACDLSGEYVPRLCWLAGLARGIEAEATCGICAVRLGDGSVALACATHVEPGMEITIDDPELRALRAERLAPILARHPHACLTCPDRDGCTRDSCTYGLAPEARCCDEFGRCEFGRLVAYVDQENRLRSAMVTTSRKSADEGRIRRTQGLCLGCGRCVAACDLSPMAGQALELALTPGLSPTARPKRETLQASGCTFCGLCVLVCPTGALTAPGKKGARWLGRRRLECFLNPPVLAPEAHKAITAENLAAMPHDAGVFTLMDAQGRVLHIGGVPDLRRGLEDALCEPHCAKASSFRWERDPIYTLRESELLARYAHEQGKLPPGNDLGDDLF